MNAAKKSNPFANPLDIRKLLGSPPPVLKHVLPSLLEGTVGAVVAPGGVGKTMLLLQLGMAVSTAHQFCGGLFADAPKNCAMNTTPGKVVFVAAEESADLLSHRLHAVSSYMLTQVMPKPTMLEKKKFLENLIENFGVHALFLLTQSFAFSELLLGRWDSCPGRSTWLPVKTQIASVRETRPRRSNAGNL